MKIVLILLALFLAFIGVALIYSTLHAKQNGFGATPMRKFFVDRHGVSGYVHQSGESVILTRRDTANPHYYLVALNG